MSSLRPSDLALFLLASGEMLPRKRARDQQADLAGLELKRRILDMLVSSDPEPEQLDAALMGIVAELGPPTGPTRAICGTIRDEWDAAALEPGFAEWLIEQALRESANPTDHNGKRGRRRDNQNGRSQDQL
ncbi:MAG TPA: hypothetical protein VFU22_27500 [Roseiflexaceae bacterium]|nr:hypothetical protein [Roseiflexaceae bacterium]